MLKLSHNYCELQLLTFFYFDRKDLFIIHIKMHILKLSYQFLKIILRLTIITFDLIQAFCSIIDIKTMLQVEVSYDCVWIDRK